MLDIQHIDVTEARVIHAFCDKDKVSKLAQLDCMKEVRWPQVPAVTWSLAGTHSIDEVPNNWCHAQE